MKIKLQPTSSDEIDILNSLIIINKTGFIVKTLKKEPPDPDGFIGKLFKKFKEEISFLDHLFQKKRENFLIYYIRPALH